MTQQTRTTLKGYFNTGDVPTETQFGDVFDSTVLHTETIGQALNAASSPSAANPFVTATSQPTWTQRHYFGSNTPSGDNNVISINSAWNGSGTALLSHAIRDESTFTSTVSGDAYAAFDAIQDVSGATHYSHTNCFQARPYYHGSGGIDSIFGHTYQLNHTGSGTVTTSIGLYMMDAQGNGPISLQAALYVVDAGLTRGAANYVIYSGSTSVPSYHGGIFQTGSDIICGGKISASNISASDARNSMGFGTGVPVASTLGYFNAFYGYNAGHSAAGDAQTFSTMIGTAAGYGNVSGSNNTFIGSYAGYNATGGGNVFLGTKAGRDETGDNRLYINNDESSSPLIYGEFNATQSSRKMQFNCGYMGFFGTTAIAKPTGVAVSAAGIHAALVSLGLIAA